MTYSNYNNLIAIHGKKQVGKDTVGKLLLSMFINDGHIVPKTSETLHSIMKSLKGKGINVIYNIVNASRQSIFATTHLIKFATPIKETVCNMIGCTLDDLENEEFKNTPIPGWVTKKEIFSVVDAHSYIKDVYLTPRMLMQFFGTEMGRKFYPDIWVSILHKRRNPNVLSIITDLRFENELNYVKKYNGVTIGVYNNDKSNTDTHESELGLNLDNMDFVIENNIVNTNGMPYSKELVKQVSEIYEQII